MTLNTDKQKQNRRRMLYDQSVIEFTYYCCNGPLKGNSGTINLLSDATVIRFPHYGRDIWPHVGFVYYRIGKTKGGYTRLYHIESIPLLNGQQN